MKTAYQLACGDVQLHSRNGVQTTLWREHNAYHIRTHDYIQHKRIAWVTVHTLTDARKEFRNATR